MEIQKLYECDDPKIWAVYLSKYDEVIKLLSTNKKKDELIQLDKWLWNNLKNDVFDRYKSNKDNGYYLTKLELLNIMKWKLLRGKFRPLQKLVDSNTEDNIKLHTGKALSILFDASNKKKNKWEDALKELTMLKGIGIATASIILSLFAPKDCAFMSDEVIGSVYDNKVDYTMKIYKIVQSKLTDKANTLNNASGNKNNNIIWDTEMLGKALWTFEIVKIEK